MSKQEHEDWQAIRAAVRECAATLEAWQAALNPKPGVSNPFEELFKGFAK